jgi:hypothetical protein
MKGLWVVQLAPEADEQPIRTVIVVPALTRPLVVQVNAGAVPVIEEQVAPLILTTEVTDPPPPDPLNEKVEAEGEAVLTPDPGKVIIIFPPLGIGFGFMNATVCMAVILVTKTSVPPCAAEDKPDVK